MISILHKDEVGLGLQAQLYNHKLGIKPDNTGNVQFELSNAGLKGNVEFPQAFDPSALQQQIAALERAKQAAEAEVQVLEGKVTALENRKDLDRKSVV